MLSLLRRLWKILEAIFTSIRIYGLVKKNRQLTDSLDWLSVGAYDRAIIAFSFDTKTGEDSVNSILAQKILETIKTSLESLRIRVIILQEEVWEAMLLISPENEISDLGEKLKVLKYKLDKNGKKIYLDSHDIGSGAVKIASEYNCRHTIVVCHNHMLKRVVAIIDNLGIRASSWLTTMKYDPQADQKWVRSYRAFALREALAYLFFAIKGWL